MKNLPIVFVSSTSEDLKDYRQAVHEAIIKAGCHPEMMEYFAAGGNPPLQTCLEKVAPCDVLVVIAAHRYGWIPDAQPGDHAKSITWLECEQAKNNGKEILAFLVDENHPWPEEKKENYVLTQAMNSGTATPDLFQKVNTAVQKLKEFKAWLDKITTRTVFITPDNLSAVVLHALEEWQKHHGKTPTPTLADPLEVPPAYKAWLMNRCANVELLAHISQTGCKPARLKAVYVPTPTIVPYVTTEKIKEVRTIEVKAIKEKISFLLDYFQKKSLYVPGLAGSGKSTFARWVAWLLCQGEMPKQVQLDSDERVEEKYPDALRDKLPLLIPFREFWSYLPHCVGQRNLSNKQFETALENWVKNELNKIDWLTVHRFLKAGQGLLLFDGVDEIPESAGDEQNRWFPREMLVNGLKQAVPEWLKQGNHLLLTSRPYGLADHDAQQMGLPQAEIVDLPEELQRLFMHRWFVALDYGAEMAAEMMAHLNSREELSELTGNPVMLMAMCVLFPEGKRLPQDKAELYLKTIERILYNRYADTRLAEQVLHCLSMLAYGMHTGSGLGEERTTPRAGTSITEIDQMLQTYLETSTLTRKGFTSVVESREDLLSRSGLLLQKDSRTVSFYHLSFQEYLAGRRLKEVKEADLYPEFQKRAAIPQWRQTLAFTFGYTFQGSPEKATSILQQMLETTSLKNLPHLALTADLVEIVYRKDYELDPRLVAKFRQLCLEAIEQEVDVRDRYNLGRALGIVGDHRIEPDLRNFPKGYVEIPSGNYQVGDEKWRFIIEKQFWFSKYPVTNSQYRLFWEDGGYNEKKWWNTAGWKWRENENITEPLYWRHGHWNGENLPVVGVSWYEADAFCRWTSGFLPYEWYWEAAGRGLKGRIFAWGDRWEGGVCNGNGVLDKTSPVGLFPRSRTPDYSLEDITGNVAEWCVSGVIVGSAFNDSPAHLRCTSRVKSSPIDRKIKVGFRVVRGTKFKTNALFI